MLEELHRWEWKRLLVLAACFWASIIIFVQLADEVIERESLPFDVPILRAMREFSSPVLDPIVVTITDVGGVPITLIVLVLGTAYLLEKGRKRAALFLSVAIGGAASINYVLKLLFSRDRPNLWQAIVTEHTYSFPSGHAMMSCVVALSLIALTWNTRWRWPVVVGGCIYFVTVSLTRIYLGVHYPSDIIAGWCIGAAWVILVGLALSGRRFIKNPGARISFTKQNKIV